ncbi:hypothetical protein CDD82_2689 [Ophiocordyceps australis]|uniref:Myb-like domain-containing protein n=1 Tax=Ophiocordyceps australis TaxID=1399860 RepID=A0A2C5Y5W3_9HYPO|nr:hypothetical protein CDD82_2689 [Ophiocordyceps australis]
MTMYNATTLNHDSQAPLAPESSYKNLTDGQTFSLALDQAYINSLTFRQDQGLGQVKKDDSDQVQLLSLNGHNSLIGSSLLDNTHHATHSIGLNQGSPLPIWSNSNPPSLLVSGNNINPRNNNAGFNAMYPRDVANESVGLGTDNSWTAILSSAAANSSGNMMEPSTDITGTLSEFSSDHGGNVFTGYQESREMEGQSKGWSLDQNGADNFMFPPNMYQSEPTPSTTCGGVGIDLSSVSLKQEASIFSPPASFNNDVELDVSMSDASIQLTSQSPGSITSPNSSAFSPTTGSTCSTLDCSTSTAPPKQAAYSAPSYNVRRRSQTSGLKGKPVASAGRLAQGRTRLPSGAPWADSITRSATTKASRRSRKCSDGSAGIEVNAHITTPTGTPYMTIHKMDPASRAILDTILLQDRSGDGRNAVPYKLIMAKLSNIYQGSEETLRGHHRRLIKPPHRRIRKPIWEDNDIELLKLAVRVCRKGAGGRVKWTEVSHFIQNNGGSYEFGVTTCSRKWAEIKDQGTCGDIELDIDANADGQHGVEDDADIAYDGNMDIDFKFKFNDAVQYSIDNDSDFESILSPE